MSAAPPVASTRLVSLDVFRGATIAAMIFVNNSGSNAYPPFRHAQWNGLTFTDLVFPFFLWIAGAAMVFSFAKRLAQGARRGQLAIHVLRRSALLFLLGLLLNGFPVYDLATLRIPGVLQRIALCYLFSALIYLYTSSWRHRLWWAWGLMAIYAVLMLYVPVPGYGPGVLEPVGNFGQYVDNLLMRGHLYRVVWDPEGLVTTLPAISTMIFGVLAGELLRAGMDGWRKTLYLLLMGNVLAFLGYLMTVAMPINKQLWTISYTGIVAGLAAVCFAFVYWGIDVLGNQQGTKFFVIYGMNAIAAYVASGIFARILHLAPVPSRAGEPNTVYGWLYGTGFPSIAPGPGNAAVLNGLLHVLVIFLLVWFLYQRRWFWKI